MSSNTIYDSSKSRLRMWEELRDLSRYRYLIYQLIRRDIMTRYKRSALGVAWTMLNPLGTMLILTFVFSRAFGAGPKFAAYILSGYIAWLFFSQSTTAAISNLIWGEGLSKRIYLPRTVFAISSLGVGLVNLLLSMVPLVLVMLFTGVPVRLSILFIPVSIILLLFFTLGVSLLVSALAVFFRDVAEMYQVILLAWMYLSPVLYPKEYVNQMPELVGRIFRINPMYFLIDTFRAPIYDGVIPEASQLLVSTVIALGTGILGWLVFTSKIDDMAYRL